METDGEEAGVELTKMEKKLIKDVIEELSDAPASITNGEQLFSMFTRFQVQPEKQLKMMYAVAFELSELSMKCEGEMCEQYLRLSNLASFAVKEKFGQSQQDAHSRRGRQAKDNAKINMTSYFDLETTLLNESSDEESSKKKRKKDKVEWSDSELKETEPVPKSPPRVEAIQDSDDDHEMVTKKASPPQQKPKLSSYQGSRARVSQRKRMIDVVCIDSSSDEETAPKAQVSSREKPPASNRNKTRSAPKAAAKHAPKAGSKKKTAPQSRPKAPPSLPVSGLNKLLAATDNSTVPKTANTAATDENASNSVKAAGAPKNDKTTAASANEGKSAGSAKGKKSVEKPVGVVKATQRKVPPNSQRSTNNVIKQDEALILNFKKGHYPTFQTSYTHLVICKKENNDLFTDTAPQLSTILAMDGQVVASDELKKYVLKQFVHNESGQFLVGEKEEDLYLIVPGVINKSKEKT